MFTLHKDIHFRAAHFLRNGYQGKCKNMHGEYYRVEIFLQSEGLDQYGMVIDFGDLKKMIFDKYDHKCMNDIAPFDILNPTAENMAKVFFDIIQDVCDNKTNQPEVLSVKVFESDTSYAQYSETFKIM